MNGMIWAKNYKTNIKMETIISMMNKEWGAIKQYYSRKMMISLDMDRIEGEKHQ